MFDLHIVIAFAFWGQEKDTLRYKEIMFINALHNKYAPLRPLMKNTEKK